MTTPEPYFARGDVSVESHFGVGGRYDDSTLDGALWQWMSTNERADANLEGNGYITTPPAPLLGQDIRERLGDAVYAAAKPHGKDRAAEIAHDAVDLLEPVVAALVAENIAEAARAPYAGLTAQECPAGKHPTWLVDSEAAHDCPWCALDAARRDERAKCAAALRALAEDPSVRVEVGSDLEAARGLVYVPIFELQYEANRWESSP